MQTLGNTKCLDIVHFSNLSTSICQFAKFTLLFSYLTILSSWFFLFTNSTLPNCELQLAQVDFFFVVNSTFPNSKVEKLHNKCLILRSSLANPHSQVVNSHCYFIINLPNCQSHSTFLTTQMNFKLPTRFFLIYGFSKAWILFPSLPKHLP
jgi:hypothetical protein